jgi:hypothetical protein
VDIYWKITHPIIILTSAIDPSPPFPDGISLDIYFKRENSCSLNNTDLKDKKHHRMYVF